MTTGELDETLIVTYSPKYKAYQRKIRNRQIERAEKMITSSEKKRKGKSPNDPARFIRKTSVTPDGEIADECIYSLDQDKVCLLYTSGTTSLEILSRDMSSLKVTLVEVPP